jgi:predicted transposase YbfD/YdcC
MTEIFKDIFSSIKDPRIDITKKHSLLDIIFLSLCGIIAGCESFEEVSDFGKAHEDWFRNFLDLKNSIPSHDTFERVFAALDPVQFQNSCIEWFKQINELIPETVIAIDGKTLRGSSRKQKGLKGLHIVNAWSCANSMVLGQIKVDGKSNEITAIPEILDVLSIKGAIVTIDAMGAQKDIVERIISHDADYVISLKGNQGTLHNAVKDAFNLYDQGSKSLRINKASDDIDSMHGRIDERGIETIDTSDFEGYLSNDFKSLYSVARVTKTTYCNGSESTENRYYISSLPASDPLAILRATRSHWQVENNLHWALDVSFNEDKSRVRNENCAINLSWMRKYALGLLKKDTSFKASIRRKQRKVAVSTEYLTKILGLI